MNYQVESTFIHPLFEETDNLFVSITFETSPISQNLSKNQIKLKNAISIIKEYENTASFVNQLESLIDDLSFWNQVKQGLVLLMSPTKNLVYFLSKPVPTMTIVDQCPYVIPLVRYFQQLKEVQLLLVNRRMFKVYRGTTDYLTLEEYPTKEPVLAEDVLGRDESQRYFGISPSSVHHGGSNKSDEEAIDTMRYFKYVDKYVLENYSKQSNLPLILVALPQYHADFRKISENPNLYEDGIKMDATTITESTLKQELEDLMIRHYRYEFFQLRDKFRTNQANGLASDFLDDIFNGLFDNRIETLFIQNNSQLLGSINPSTRTFQLDPNSIHDILLDATNLALSAKTRVLILDEDEMPTNHKLAAIMRY